jgi:hypothetical protein
VDQAGPAQLAHRQAFALTGGAPLLSLSGCGAIMVNYLELPVGDNCPEVINAVIEIPAEGINKYEYDKTLHVFRLDRNL